MKPEKWLPIPGYEGRYSVSDQGDVMSMNYNRLDLLKIMQPHKGRFGYLSIVLFKGNRETRRRFQVHQLVMLAFVGPRPEGLQINHKNGIKTDNRLANLEYCTATQNLQHALDTGLRRNLFGENHNMAKLTEAQVLEIKAKLAAGEKQKSIAAEYHVSNATICLIANGKNWVHVN